MKLADSWIKNGPVPIVTETFHDEGEEYDEVDEIEDGCGAVVWQPYVLKQAHTSNKRLHELAREIRGVEKRRGKKLTLAHYRSIFTHWEIASKPFLRPGHDYFTYLLAKLDCVTVPKGETLKAAFERARRADPPAKLSVCRSSDLRLFACLCRELQVMAGDQPIKLHQVSLAKLFGHSHWRTIGSWIKALKTLELLKLAEPAIANERAARYFYTE